MHPTGTGCTANGPPKQGYPHSKVDGQQRRTVDRLGAHRRFPAPAEVEPPLIKIIPTVSPRKSTTHSRLRSAYVTCNIKVLRCHEQHAARGGKIRLQHGNENVRHGEQIPRNYAEAEASGVYPSLSWDLGSAVLGRTGAEVERRATSEDSR